MKRALSPASMAALSLQRGAALVVTVVMLAGLTLATTALVRNADTANLLAGNIAFQRATIKSSDAGVEAAIAWLANAPAALEQDQPGHAYYASAVGNWDMTGNRPGAGYSRVMWEGAACQPAVQAPAQCLSARTLRTDAAGNTVRYVIQRLCSASGPVDAPGNACQALRLPGKRAAVYYRITVRVRGPRHTVSTTEAVVREGNA